MCLIQERITIRFWILKDLLKTPDPVRKVSGEEFEVEKFLSQRPRGRAYFWLALMMGNSKKEAECHPTTGFKDRDGTLTAAVIQCIQEKNLFP